MATADSVKAKIQNLINRGNSKTGASDKNLTDVVSRLIGGYGVGNGVTPTGTKTITANGSYDVTNFASALVNIQGINAKIYTVDIDSDKTASVTLLQNDHLKSLRNDPNAFVMMRCMNPTASTAMVHFWFTSNFILYYSGATAYNSIIARATASTSNLNGNTNGLPGDNYNAHLNIDTNGKLWAIPNATYPIKAGTYQIIAGTVESL